MIRFARNTSMGYDVGKDKKLTERKVMLSKRFIGIVSTFVLAFSLVACGGGPVSYKQELLTDASGIKVTAENAGSDQSAVSASAIEVKDGDVICISPCLDKGSFHLTITSSDGKNTVYDKDTDGRVLFTIEAAPGKYDVKTTGNNATGWMTVFAMSTKDIQEQNDALKEKLEQEGVEQETIDELTQGGGASSSSSSSQSN